MGGIQVITGLGNPGARYDQTRHNVGFWFVDELARQQGAAFRPERRVQGEVVRLRIGAGEVWLLKPATFMNHSGQALRGLAGFYRIPVEDILVVHDDIDLPPGTVRLKRGGGHGGHNGLRDIIAHLGKDFWRLRIGVGHPGHRDEVIAYVLSRPTPEEERLIRGGVESALPIIPLLVSGEMERAMHKLHSPRPESG